jgi:hypothetical protein
MERLGKERHGRKSREVAVSESGDERINSSRNAVTLCAKSRRASLGLPNRVTGFPKLVRSSQPPAVKFAPANRWLELLAESGIVDAGKLMP